MLESDVQMLVLSNDGKELIWFIPVLLPFYVIEAVRV